MNALEALAPLFRYPGDDFIRRVEAARRVVPAVAAFARVANDIDELQSVYSTTFDLAPSCSPYLGTHVFGDDSRGRARLMLGLKMKGLGAAELPDHVAEVLGNAGAFGEEEWRELRELVLVPALEKMEALLAESNPYRALVAAALAEGGHA